MLWMLDSGNQGAFVEVMRRHKGRLRETKKRGTKISRGIQMHLSSRVNPLVCLFSFQQGHWPRKKRCPVYSVQTLLCMCVCLRETVLADVCILAGWTVFAFESMSRHACTKGDASLCTHPSIIPSHLCLTRSSRVKDVQPRLRASQLWLQYAYVLLLKV